MDEFHNFADLERGIVWELTLGMLPAARPPAAAVGHGRQRAGVPRTGCERCHRPQAGAGRGQGTQGAADVPLGARRVPRRPARAHGQGRGRRPNDRRPWSSASTATSAGAWPRCSRGWTCCRRARRAALNDEVDKLEWPQGVGPKLKQMLRRGVGVHHAGLLPKYRRVVEELFTQQAAGRRASARRRWRPASTCRPARWC